MKVNKIKVYTGTLIILVIIFLIVSCSTSNYSNKEEQVETIRVGYLVFATSDVETISATYSNSQGGTEQVSGLKPDPEFVNESGVNIFVVASYEEFPKDEFLYLSVQNECESGELSACIMISGEQWKSSKAKGGYTIATASGFYDD